jgi:hypothetical protein
LEFLHLVVEVVALTGTLTHAGEHGQAAVCLGDVVDQFHHVDGLADAGAAEQADLATLGKRAHQVDDLDAGFQQLSGRGLVFVRRGRTVDFPGFAGGHRTGFVDRTTQHVHDAAQGARTDRHRDGAFGVGGNQVALQAVGGAQRDAADHAVTELLLHFQRDFGVVHLQRVVHLRHRFTRELDVDDGADDLNDLAGDSLLSLLSILN